MTVVRNNGFAISLVVLAFIVCYCAIERQITRSTRTSVQAVGLGEFNFDDSECEMLLVPPPGRVIIGDSGQTRVSLDAAHFGMICPAVELQESEVEPPSFASKEPPKGVPSPVDAYPGEPTGTDDDAEEDEASNLAVRSVIERELAHTTREERDIWFDELKTLPAGVVRDLLQVRKQLRALPRLLGGIPEKLASVDSVPAPRQREIAAEPASQKIRFQFPDDYSATTALETAISQLRHNLMNATTPGFKRLRVTLVDSYSALSQESISSDVIDRGSQGDSSIRGQGCRVAPLQIDLKQGILKNTGRQLDLAIQGEGFFIVRHGDRELLTRCGAFALDRDRQLCLVVAEASALIQPAIKIPEDLREIQIAADGTVTVLKSSDATLTNLGQLQLARVASPSRLQPVGQTLYTANEDSGPIVVGPAMTDGMGELQQGVLEQSNVDFQAELDEIEDIMMILKALPLPHSRPVTATGPQSTPAR